MSDESLRELVRKAAFDPMAAFHLLMARDRVQGGALTTIQNKLHEICRKGHLSLGNVAGALRVLKKEQKVHTIIGFVNADPPDCGWWTDDVPKSAFLTVGRIKGGSFAVRVHRRHKSHVEIWNDYKKHATSPFRGYTEPRQRWTRSNEQSSDPTRLAATPFVGGTIWSVVDKRWSVVHLSRPLPPVDYRAFKKQDAWQFITEEVAATLRQQFLEFSMAGPGAPGEDPWRPGREDTSREPML